MFELYNPEMPPSKVLAKRADLRNRVNAVFSQKVETLEADLAKYSNNNLGEDFFIWVPKVIVPVEVVGSPLLLEVRIPVFQYFSANDVRALEGFRALQKKAAEFNASAEIHNRTSEPAFNILESSENIYDCVRVNLPTPCND